MMLKYFLTRWLEKISGFALVFVKTFQMSVGHDDEIVVGQIPLEKGCRGEGTWISSWALDEVAPSIEAFGSVTVKYCGAQIIFQFCYIWSLSFFFFFPMWLELFCERVQVSCIVEKNTCISSHFCHFSCSFWRHQSLGFEFFALGFLRRLFPRRLSSVKFRMFFLSFFIIWWIMFNRRIE